MIILENKKAVIAMSGGVDSSVAAYLMKEKGYDISGITLKLIPDECDSTCLTENDIEDAKKVSESLGIPHRILNFTGNFKEKVIDKFVNTYIEGGTPNPCIECNRHLKFAKLLEEGEKLGFDYVVTGHYAKIEYNEKSGRYLLKKGSDESKDQSYVLYSLTQKQLSKTIFPLGNLTKNEIREIAAKLEFVNADKADSQDICFVKDGNYIDFIDKYTGRKRKHGNFVDKEGNILGTHKGIECYTIGQRKGLGLALKQPMYVCSKNTENNTVVLGLEEDLMTDYLTACDVNFIPFDNPAGEIRVTAKTRYKQKESPATVSLIEPGRVAVKFDVPQRAVAKGQAVVFYDGDIVVGGGTIE